jgi:hypothetical protein
MQIYPICCFRVGLILPACQLRTKRTDRLSSEVLIRYLGKSAYSFQRYYYGIYNDDAVFIELNDFVIIVDLS